MNRSAVIFDLDGTLTKANLDFDAIRAEIGVDGPILEAVAGLDPAAQRKARAVLLRHEQEAARHAVLREGAIEAIDACRAEGFAVAILTRNARHAVDVIFERHGIVVDALRTRDDGAIKPSGEPVLALCRQLGADPRRSWMVGDYLFDIQSGRDAGTRTVLIVGEEPPPTYADQADHVIRRLIELGPILRKNVES